MSSLIKCSVLPTFRLVSYKNAILHYCCCDGYDGFMTNSAGLAKSSLICKYHMINSEANISITHKENTETSFTLDWWTILCT